ncbi:quercetin dioxygenase-like cupin family protein [Parabacteroides sp. PFB2-12]|uniref:cupin domain-containing protein n=1 Tax=unclassified Parabacteroides TaxID=2649774 RepID=UPI002472F844|nr:MULTISPECIES: cupin domain-containing protein [unclassified Parabacteroides]MDH6341696.1 quercetin dioxygenase-like cupin family protein [Parabacteroides sp. PM6-13]MDH6389881.1 quercetin dioxygenase-like cupin family protein [Parabacteroides sp. PFB2-12]MDL2309959.1 cupin domain-containing protein [Parabacteroides sp. OttesenSCG-928-B22]
MKRESKDFIYEEETIWEVVGEGVRRQVMAYNDQLMLVKVAFEAGAVGAPHTHPHTQATYVVSGLFEFTTDGHTSIIKAGDCVYIKPDVLHGCKCVEAGTLIDTFAPMREDFLVCP